VLTAKGSQPFECRTAISRAILLTCNELCRKTDDTEITPLNREGAVGLAYLRVKYLEYIAFKIFPAKSILRVESLLPFQCDMMKAVAQTKPTSEELRHQVEELRSTAAHLQE